MPKGSKKRKASKKKAHHHHNPNNHDDAPHSSHNNGDDEMKHHDDKESDGEEVNSPISQDNRNSQLDLTDGEKEEREKVDNRPHSPSSSDDSQSVDESAVHPEVVPVTVEAGGSGVDEELKPEEQSNGEAQNVEVVYNNSVSSQTQQPDDESAYNAVKATNELKEDKSTDVVVEPVKENGDEYLEKSSPFEKTAASEEEDPLISSYEAVNTLPEGLHPATDATPVEEKSDAVEENGSVSEVDKVALPDEKSIEDGIASGASVKIEDVTVPRTPGNGEKEVILLEKGVDTPPVDLGSQKEGDETDIVLPDGNLSASPLTEGNLMLSKNVTTSDVRNSAEQKKDIEVSESSVRQPLLAARPQPRTSWMNCCGLFEAFGGSSR